MPNLYIIAGCNGAGKTTASYKILPNMLNCREFVNADGIAAGLSSFNPGKVAIEAGRIMLSRIDTLLDEGVDFAIETTLATKSYVSLIKEARAIGYKITLVFFWLSSPQEAKSRVATRVSKGGHYIADDVVDRRYYKGLFNLRRLYMPVRDFWMIFNNTEGSPELVAEGEFDRIDVIYNHIATIFGIPLKRKAMKIKAENIELSKKIVEGVNIAFRNLVVESAEKNEKLVIADKEGNIQHVPAKDLLKKLSTK